MLAHGIAVGLGTDGACTNNNLDLWEEMRLAPLLAKVSALDPKPLPATEALWMATRLGGRPYTYLISACCAKAFGPI
jgi:5-methylthioadenosine/S-adenosylhomocysteine deaminase